MRCPMCRKPARKQSSECDQRRRGGVGEPIAGRGREEKTTNYSDASQSQSDASAAITEKRSKKTSMILPFAHHLHEAAQHGEWRPVIDHLSALYSGGGRGIRTPEWVPPLTVFKTAAFNRSAIPPLLNYLMR
jgi:hypothetical protein